jgi:hypothetical protein
MDEYSQEIALPSGRHAQVRRGKGRDLIRAHRVVAGNPEPMAVSFALVAELTQIDGKPLVYEDVLGMDLADVLVLQAEALGGGENTGNFPMPSTPVLAAVDV